MKYNDNNQPLSCMQTNSTCYKGTTTMTVKGVLWHSTGANNPYLKRYVQPYAGVTVPGELSYNELMSLLGTNVYGNDWNHIEHQAGLNAWIGKLADESVTTVQTMPWNYRPWGCGSGSNGSCNTGWVQFEICEDGLSDPAYFNAVYQEACELTAYLCKRYGLDPFGTATVGYTNAPVILCHNDAYKLGVGSGHADVMHWFPTYGKSMETVRADVSALMSATNVQPEVSVPAEPTVTETPTTQPSTTTTPSVTSISSDQFEVLMNEYIKNTALKAPSDWSQEARSWIEGIGGMSGDENGNMMYQKNVTRQEMAQILYAVFKRKGLL